jgi:MHS family proline/betaine transporter-like MFS transporter
MLTKLFAPIFKTKLTKQQKHATVVLSIGTFLEYFDLYLYIHMAFILNKEFFPSSAGNNNWFFASLTLCTNFMFRPLGAVILGWLGDNFGRKSTIFLSTTVTAICCVVIGSLPGYEKIGITAAYTLTACRILQSMLSSAEVQGARIYLMEITESLTEQCFLSSIVAAFTCVGRLGAILVANIFINFSQQSWRSVFWAGAIVAIVGAYARSSLKETQEFADAKRRLRKIASELSSKARGSHPLFKAKLDKKDAFYLFILKCGEAVAIYFTYIYCSQIFSSLGLSDGQCIKYVNFASIHDTIVAFTIATLVFYFNPMKIVKFVVSAASICFLVVPLLLQHFPYPTTVLFCQLVLLSFMIGDFPASPFFYKRFPVLQRFTSILMINALSRAITWPICAFGVQYLTNKVGHYGLYVVLLPTAVLSLMGVRHFINANKKTEYLEQQSKIKASMQNI